MTDLVFDRDDLALLHEEPELLAVADAFRATQRELARTRPRRRVVVAAGVAVALALPTLAFSGVLDSFFGLSNQGTTVSTNQLDLSEAQILKQHGVDVGTGITLLATRGGIAFYASRTTDGRTCFLNGPAGGSAPRQIVISTLCEAGFPSADQPILGMYVLVRKPLTPLERPVTAREGPQLGKLGPQSVGGLQGLAADGVADVEAIDADGNVILRAPVFGNVYFARRDLQHTDITVPAEKIVALDASGDVLYTEAIPQPAYRAG